MLLNSINIKLGQYKDNNSLSIFILTRIVFVCENVMMFFPPKKVYKVALSLKSRISLNKIQNIG